MLKTRYICANCGKQITRSYRTRVELNDVLMHGFSTHICKNGEQGILNPICIFEAPEEGGVTEGEWAIGISLDDPSSYHVSAGKRTDGKLVTVCEKMTEADARLVSSAKDMFEALKHLDIQMDFDEPLKSGVSIMYQDARFINEGFLMAVNALKKAKGE